MADKTDAGAAKVVGLNLIWVCGMYCYISVLSFFIDFVSLFMLKEFSLHSQVEHDSFACLFLFSIFCCWLEGIDYLLSLHQHLPNDFSIISLWLAISFAFGLCADTNFAFHLLN